ncbi:tRNA (adenosine(37)-N6)-dimethylallyltransferase MiaA [Legionella sp. 27cVA30]|uniref:tRNA dimethylallyltransferase n=1 Tax=Legionella septentrionalis TaxID=2498109 RepID=A0A433JLC0_9GAMM|nr:MULTISPECIES: tRNA (adenosine(37)-N6)-dimethylallyltransferase MiaA [Legionella]MCP0914578.1 tRNA (adenosine(37)-N6)-dimethylallyltransferase MiaA [Legionella sp. 27cVA30]RUQ90086.1 tRNA (adenosine(37)-N6)-dimethylallyltransferase MiaA [Legionella septentrionalis]
MAKLVFCLMGPTASGKTDIACKLLQQFPFEIISVDSALIYREMDIGTAKPDAQILAKAPHHLLDILNPPDHYSAANFCDDVEKLCSEIYDRGNIPLLVGGTMMYFRALQQGLSALPQADDAIRKTLSAQAQEHGWAYMHELLKKVDPVSAQRIHAHDTQRIQRALEVYAITTKPLSECLKAEMHASDYQFINLMLMPENRQWLHERIATRFTHMLDAGFLDEVRQLLDKWSLTLDCPALRSVGYRQAFLYLRGEYDYPTFCAKGIAATRQLAKRQLTWLRHWPEGFTCVAENPGVFGEIIVIIKKILDNKRKIS